MSISISPPQSCTERSQSYVFSSAIGGEVAAHRNLLSRTMLFGQGLFLQNFTFPNRKKRWSLFHCVRACSWLYLPFVHNACNFTGKGGIALDNATRYGLYRKVVKYRWRLGGVCSIQLSYWDIFKIYAIFIARRNRTICRLGGGPSILVRYGGIYRIYSILQGSGIRTVRLLGGDHSILNNKGG